MSYVLWEEDETNKFITLVYFTRFFLIIILNLHKVFKLNR